MGTVGSITVYSTHCPRCIVLEEKLKNKGLLFEVVSDVEKVLTVARRNNISMVPFVLVNEGGGAYRVLDYNQAIQYFKL